MQYRNTFKLHFLNKLKLHFGLLKVQHGQWCKYKDKKWQIKFKDGNGVMLQRVHKRKLCTYQRQYMQWSHFHYVYCNPIHVHLPKVFNCVPDLVFLACLTTTLFTLAKAM